MSMSIAHCVSSAGIAASFFIFCLPCSPASSSARTTHMYGTVRDDAGKAAPGALVRFVSGADTTSALTDDSGKYLIQLVTQLPVAVDDHPSGFTLGQNYPNPFNPSTVIEYTLPAPSDVRLDIYSISGQKVRTLVDGHEAAGSKSVRWDGRDQRGKGAAAGVYLYRLRAGKFVQARKMLLLDGGSAPVAGKATATASPLEQPGYRTFTFEVKKEGFQTYREQLPVAIYAYEQEKSASLTRQFMLLAPPRVLHDNSAVSAEVFGVSEPLSHSVPEMVFTTALGDTERVMPSLLGPQILHEPVFAYYPLGLRGSLPSHYADAAVPGNGMLEVTAQADTISASYLSQSDGDTVPGLLGVGEGNPTGAQMEIVGGRVYEYSGGWLLLSESGGRSGISQYEFFVTFKSGTPQESIDALNSRLGVTVENVFYDWSYVVRIGEGTDLMEAMKAYLAEPIVKSTQMWM